MQRNKSWQVLALVAALAVSVEARAQEEAAATTSPGAAGNFGQVGQVVISSDFNGSIGFTSGSGSDAFFIALRPAADYFFKENLSLGGSVTLATAFVDGSDPLEVGLGVRAGYNIPMNDKVSVWPRLGLGVTHQSAGDRTYLQIVLEGPFLIHFAPHFFVGGGPGLVTQIGDGTTATLQVSTIVGGYF